jgi:inactivated superfamily I helicase
MLNPFDTGIRLTVIRTPGRTTCSVDEFVSCPTNARADEAVTARDEWQRLAETEAREHLATARQLIEAQAERDAARAEALHLRQALNERNVL